MLAVVFAGDWVFFISFFVLSRYFIMNVHYFYH